MARGGYNPEAEEAAKKDRAAAQSWLKAEAEALAESSATRRSAEAQSVSGPPGARHVADAPPVMSMETDEGLRRVMEREEQLMSVEPEGATTTSGKPGVASSGAAVRADAAPAGGAPDPLAAIRAKINRSISAIDGATGDYKKALIAQKDKLVEQEGQIAGEQQEITARADRRVRAMELMDQRQEEATARADAEIRNAERMVTSHEIDPNRAFKTTGARVGSAIAIAMSALGQGMSGRAGANTAYKIINDAINRDIDLQKEELRTRKDVLLNKNNLFANMMAKFGNERSAELATQQAGIAAAKQSLEALKAVHKGENAAMVIDSQIAQLTQAGEKGKMQLFQIQAQLAIADVNAQARAGARGGAGKQGSTAGKIRMALAQVKDLRKQWKEVGGFEGVLGSMVRGVLGEGSVPILTTDDVTTYEGLRTITAKFITNATDGGRPTDKDFAVLLALIPPSATPQERGEKMIDTLEDILTRAAEVGGMSIDADGRGFIERYGKSIGMNVNLEYGKRKGDVDALKAELGFKEGV